MIIFILGGLSRTSGVLYVAVINLCGVSREAATEPFSIRFCVRNLSGPLIGLLGQKYGIRMVTTTGGLVAALGSVLCYFAPNVFWITMFWGVIHGLGIGLSTTLHMLAINQYFDKYKASALGLGYSGDCFGAFVLPVIAEYLLSTYDAKGTFLIIGGIVLNVIPLAFLLRKPSWVKDKNNPSKQEEISNKKHKDFTMNIHPRRLSPERSEHLKEQNPLGTLRISNETDNLERKQGQDNKAFESSEGDLALMFNKKNKAINLQQSSPASFVLEKRLENKSDKLKYLEDHQKREVTNESKIVLKSGINSENKTNFVGGVAQENVSGVNAEHFASHIVADDVFVVKMDQQFNRTKNVTNEKPKSTSTLKIFLKTNIKPMFMLISISMAVYAFSFVCLLTVIIDFAIDLGIPENQGKYLIIGFSVADMIGRLSFGQVIDRKLIQVKNFCSATMLLMGVFSAAIPLYASFNYLMACVCLYGMLQGGVKVVFPVLINLYMEENSQSVAMGCLTFYGGLLLLLMAPMIGFYRDNTGSYNCVFYIIGGAVATVGMVWQFEPIVVRIQNRFKK